MKCLVVAITASSVPSVLREFLHYARTGNPDAKFAKQRKKWLRHQGLAVTRRDRCKR